MPATDNLARFSSWLARTVGAAEFRDVYELHEDCLLGAGSFGKVLKGTDKVSGSACAIKVIAKLQHPSAERRKRMEDKCVKQEIEVMQRLDHPHIVRLFDHYEDRLNHYLVMELCSGGKLVDYLARKQDYRESDAALLMKQVLSAIKYMHDCHIVHRDVKPDNMLLQSWTTLESNTLKVADFGLACRCDPGSQIRLSAGTPEFISPQAIDSSYDTQTDLWSCGVSMYFLLCGYAPFRAETDSGIFKAVRRGNFSFSSDDWRHVSDSAKDLLRSLIKMNPHERTTADEALNHVWVRQRAPGTSQRLQKAVSNFYAKSVQRKCPQQDENALFIRSVLDEFSQWANSILPQKKAWEATAENHVKSIYWL